VGSDMCVLPPPDIVLFVQNTRYAALQRQAELNMFAHEDQAVPAGYHYIGCCLKYSPVSVANMHCIGARIPKRRGVVKKNPLRGQKNLQKSPPLKNIKRRPLAIFMKMVKKDHYLGGGDGPKRPLQSGRQWSKMTITFTMRDWVV
jgi:hypothetical protein